MKILSLISILATALFCETGFNCFFKDSNGFISNVKFINVDYSKEEATIVGNIGSGKVIALEEKERSLEEKGRINAHYTFLEPVGFGKNRYNQIVIYKPNIKEYNILEPSYEAVFFKAYSIVDDELDVYVDRGLCSDFNSPKK